MSVSKHLITSKQSYTKLNNNLTQNAVILEKLIAVQLHNKFPVFMEPRRLCIVFIIGHYWPHTLISYVFKTNFHYHPYSSRNTKWSILFGSYSYILYAFIFYPTCAVCPAHLILRDMACIKVLDAEYYILRSSSFIILSHILDSGHWNNLSDELQFAFYNDQKTFIKYLLWKKRCVLWKYSGCVVII